LTKSNFALKALRILGLEEVLKLSEILHERQVPLKKVAGDDFVGWNDAADKKLQKRVVEPEPAKILAFPKKARELETYQEEVPENSHSEIPILEEANDALLWQREITRNNSQNISKLHAFSGYKKATEMYVVKVPTAEGKDKITFAATAGVLVNKKQA